MSLALKAINQAKNETILSEHYNIFICIYLAHMLIIVAPVVFILGHFVLRTNPLMTNIDSAILLAFGLCYARLARGRLDTKVATHVIAALSSLFFCFVAYRFYKFIGPSLWLFGFIPMVMAVVQSSTIRLTYSGGTMLLFALYAFFFHRDYSPNDLYYVFQFVFFVCVIFTLIVVSRINGAMVKRLMLQLREVKKHVKERKKVEAINERMALYDQLTGLPNRMLLYDRLGQALENAKQYRLEVCLMFIDIDYFKTINDTMGHSAGDKLLKLISERLSESCRKSDTIARIGGDEFLIIIQDVSNAQIVLKRANHILQQMSKPFFINDQSVNITCSIGISRFPDDGEDAETLVKGADIAMYKAKEDGKNGFMFYSEKLKKSHQNEMQMIFDLKDALAHDEFELFYQPQLNGVTKEIIGFEALLRWNHPSLGLLPPAQFIPLAEKTGYINPIGQWVLRTACMQNKAWQEAGVASVPMAVNLSANQICSNVLVEQVASILEETGLNPGYLELEITERTVISEMKRIKDELERLKKLGVRIAIDDFGTGFSSMQYLRELPVDLIKIPIDFVHGIDNNVKDESIISVILTLAASLDLEVIAEGVETKNQLNFLLDRMCNNIQGFYFSRPMRAKNIADFCQKNREKTFFAS